MAKRSAGAAVRSRRPFNRGYVGYLYVLPFIIGFALFSFYPIAASFYYSFFDFDYLGKMNYIGLDNFVRAYNDINFKLATKSTLIFVLFAVPGKILSALFLAMLLNIKTRLTNLYRTIFYIPSILAGSVAIGILWRLMFQKEGVINTIAGALGIPPQTWLGDPKTAIYILCLLPIWQVGSSMVIFLSGLKQIPEHLYEAARIDGASKASSFFHITLPMLSPIILFNVVMQTINSFQEFASAFVVTAGGPAKSTYMMVLMIYNEAFKTNRMGYASAISWMLVVMIIIATGLIFLTSKKWVFYEDS